MIKVGYCVENGKKMIAEDFDPELSPNYDFSEKWINVINPSDKEIEFLSRELKIEEDSIKAALDEEETARIQYEDGTLLVIIDIPIIEEDDDGDLTYTTIPFSIISSGNFLMTVCLQESAVTRDLGAGRIKDADPKKRSRFIFQILFNAATKYLQYLRQIDKKSQRIQTMLHKSMKNKELIELLDLEKSLVYFSTSLRANDLVIDKLLKTGSLKKYEEDSELLEDVAVENKQAIEMCNIYRDILSGTMDAFASVISNNLNIVMKIMTSLTIIIAVANLVASYFGMNVGGIPGQGGAGFTIIIFCSLLLAAGAWVVLYKKKMM